MLDGVIILPLAGPVPDDEMACSAAGEQHPAQCGREFIAGPENRLAATAISALLDADSSGYNPLVLYGPPGAGKSHLVRGLAAHWRSARAKRVLEVSGADFGREVAAAIESQSVSEFRLRYREIDLLVIDDLTHLASKRGALQELAQILEEGEKHGVQAVVTSRLPPQEMPTLPAALIGRLTAGLTVPLAFPSSEARMAILQRQAVSRGIGITAAAARLLADAIDGSAPELMGTLVELRFAHRDAAEIEASHVRQYLAERVNRHKPDLRRITAITAKYFGLKATEVTSPSRRRAVVQARGVAMYLARELTAKSLQQVGAHFGGRDHTTVLHSYRTTERQLRGDPITRRAVSDLRKMLAPS